MRQQNCPNLNCQIPLPFGHASVWGFLDCPYCGVELVLNDVYFPLRWLVVGINRRNPLRAINCSNCGLPFHTKRTCPQQFSSARKKVFIYIPVPQRLAKEFPERKYEPHITLLHIGDMTKGQYKRLLTVVDQILDETTPFRVEMSHYDEFRPQGDYYYPHMVINSVALEALHHRLRDAIRDLNITVKHYGFTPHATLDKLEKEEEYTGAKPTGSWLVDQIVVVGFDDYVYELVGEAPMAAPKPRRAASKPKPKLVRPKSKRKAKRQVIIMRGIPGSGKSTYLAEHYPDAMVARADDFFTKPGGYKFIPKLAWLAHKTCYDKYLALLEAGIPLVAVDNTNITKSEVRKYRDAALEHGYDPLVITILETPHKSYKAGVHGVSREIINKMAKSLDRTVIPEEWEELVIDYT